MDCKSCKKESVEPIPFNAFESVKASLERTIKRLWILLIILVLLLVGTNIAWIIYESQFEIVETEVTQDIDTEEGDALVAGVGSVYYGESPANSTYKNKTAKNWWK